jgi:hypothetical protein
MIPCSACHTLETFFFFFFFFDTREYFRDFLLLYACEPLHMADHSTYSIEYRETVMEFTFSAISSGVKRGSIAKVPLVTYGRVADKLIGVSSCPEFQVIHHQSFKVLPDREFQNLLYMGILISDNTRIDVLGFNIILKINK